MKNWIKMKLDVGIDRIQGKGLNKGEYLMRIGHNLSAINANNSLIKSINGSSSISEKLSSGYSINRAADNAAGLSISEKMRSQIRGLEQASINAQDGISLIQTAEGALNEVHSILQRINEISVQAANDTYNEEDRNNIQKEVNQLIKEVDRIATDTEFNTIKLLDGTMEGSGTSNSPVVVHSKNNSMTLQELLNSPSEALNIIYIEEIDEYATIKDTTDAANTITGHADLKRILQKEIIPQAVKGILEAFSPAFNYLESSSIGIGLRLYTESSNTLAYVGGGYSYYPSTGQVVNNMFSYQLGVNMSTLRYDGSGQLTSDSRTALETTIVHEMVHAFMDEALTNGMMGVSNGYINSSNSFPSWFKEGMAQAAAGGYSDDNDWVKNGLGIDLTTSQDDIAEAVKKSSNALTNPNSSTTEYGTGYLAAMYLGYLASGSTSITSQNISNGLGKILGDLIAGNTLDEVIKTRSGGMYTSTSDFQNKFGDTNSAAFIYNLTQAVGNGNGGVIAPLIKRDLLDDSEVAAQIFILDIEHEEVTNIYPSDVTVFSGGGKSSTGSAPVAGYSGGTPPSTTTPTTPTTPPTTPTTPTTPPTPPTTPTIIGGVKIQIGANANQNITITIKSTKAQDLGIDGISVLSHNDAGDTIDKCYNAINKVSEIRSNLGVQQNRLEHSINYIDNAAENLQNAESRIRDMNMAKGMMEYAKYQILIQAGQAILSQANRLPNNVLGLLA